MLTPIINKTMTLSFWILLIALIANGQKWKSLESITYFPPEIYQNLNDKIDSMGFIGASIFLSKFKEQKLFKATDSSSMFRFTWRRSFDPPMIFLLTKSNSKILLQTKIGNKINDFDMSYYDIKKLKKKDKERFQKYQKGQLDSMSVRDLFEITGFYVEDPVPFRYSTEVKEVSNKDYIHFISLLNKVEFWKATLTLGSGAHHDGEGWLLEGYTKEKGYHAVKRHSPGSEGKQKGIKEIGDFIISLYGDVPKGKTN